MNTRQLLSVGIDIGTTTTQVIFSHLELVNRAAVSQVPRYEFIKREISWQSPVFFTPVDKQGGLKEAELKTLILEQYQAAGIAPESVDSGAIIITGESAKTRNARPAVMALSRSLGDFVVASAGPHLESVIAGHGAGAQTLSEQRLCRVLNIDIGGGTANYALFDAGKISGTACLNVGGRLLETDSQGRVVYAHKPGQMIVDECFGAGTDARSLTGAQLVQVTRRMAELIVEVIDGTLSPLAQALMQTGLLPAGVTPEIITLSGGVGECYRHQPADPFCFADIGPLLATALHDHPRLREMNVQFPALSAGANFGADQVTMEARNYGLARHYDPFIVNTVVGFIGPEYLYNDRQIIRAGLEDHFMGKLSGISMGCDCCYTNHADADQNLNENLMILLATAGCNYIMGMPLGDDIMLNYQTTAFHDTATVRQLLNLRPSPEFERWLESMGIMANGRLTKRAGDPSLFF